MLVSNPTVAPGRLRWIVLVAALGLTAAGCSSSASDAPPAASRPTATTLVNPFDLYGNWMLTAPDVEPGTVLQLGNQLTWWRSCGASFGDWRADDHGLFVGSVSGASVGTCAETASTPPWLARAARFDIDGPRRTLRADDGAVVATLSPGGSPTPGPDNDPTMAAAPDPGPAIYQPAAALPAPLKPASRAAVVGSWRPAATGPSRGGVGTAAGVGFGDDGGWTGSDGCNGSSGRWTAGDEGSFLATGGVRTLIGCDNVDVPGWLVSAARAGLDGEVLVLLDVTGKELGRLVRA